MHVCVATNEHGGILLLQVPSRDVYSYYVALFIPLQTLHACPALASYELATTRSAGLYCTRARLKGELLFYELPYACTGTFRRPRAVHVHD